MKLVYEEINKSFGRLFKIFEVECLVVILVVFYFVDVFQSWFFLFVDKMIFGNVIILIYFVCSNYLKVIKVYFRVVGRRNIDF